MMPGRWFFSFYEGEKKNEEEKNVIEKVKTVDAEMEENEEYENGSSM